MNVLTPSTAHAVRWRSVIQCVARCCAAWLLCSVWLTVHLLGLGCVGVDSLLRGRRLLVEVIHELHKVLEFSLLEHSHQRRRQSLRRGGGNFVRAPALHHVRARHTLELQVLGHLRVQQNLHEIACQPHSAARTQHSTAPHAPQHTTTQHSTADTGQSLLLAAQATWTKALLWDSLTTACK